MYTGHPPRPPRASTEYEIKNRIVRGERVDRPTLHEGGLMSDAMWDVTTKCWAQKPHERPSADIVVRKMWDILQAGDPEAAPAESVVESKSDHA